MSLKRMVQDTHLIQLDTEINMPGTKSVLLQSRGKTSLVTDESAHWAKSTLLCNRFCNKSCRRTALVVRAVHCDSYSHSKLLLIQDRIMETPYYITDIIYIFPESFFFVIIYIWFYFLPQLKDTKATNYNATTALLIIL